MKSKILSSYSFHVLLAAILISSYLPTFSAEPQEVQIHLSEVELQEIFRNPTRSYVYIGREVSDIADLMTEISALDDNEDSLVHGLKNHIERGFNIGNYDSVAQALEYAEQVLARNRNSLDEEKGRALTQSLNAVIELVINEQLNLDAEILSFLKGSVDATENVTRNGLRLLVINEKMHVHGKSKFFKDVIFTHDVKIKGSLSVAGAISAGSLSVTDEIVDCNLTVGCNLSMSDSLSPAVGNVIKNGTPFIHTYPGSVSGNTFVGENAGNFTMTGTENSAFGVGALVGNTSGIQNTAIGKDCMTNNVTGSSNVAVGWIVYTSGDFNVIVGSDAGNNGSQNVGIGHQVLYNNNADQNIAIGYQSMFNNDSGASNTAVGYQALINNSGSSNIAIGANAGSSLTTGDNNIYISNVGTDESNTTRIGDVQTRTFIAGISGVTTDINDAVPVMIDSAGQLGVISSTRRVKHNIQDMADDSEAIYQLNPVTFAYNSDKSETKQYGLIAEEVDQVFSDIVVKDEAGNPYTVQYQVLPVLLLNEMKKLAARVAVLEARE